MELCDRIDALLRASSAPVLVALDGRCATGKTTLAARLAARYGCAVCHLDDFFLRPHQRTPERLATPGGNIDHERFLSEVLLPLRGGRPVVYRPWSCRTQSFLAPVALPASHLVVLEGAYSLHPALRAHYDLRCVLTAPLPLRLERLRAREGDNFPSYPARWIPLEDTYFDTCGVDACAHLVLTQSELDTL